MPTTLRKPLGLFLLTFFGQFAALLFNVGTAGLTLSALLSAVAVAAVVTAVWDFLVHRPVRRGLGRLEQRMRTLTLSSRTPPLAIPAEREADPLTLDRQLLARQKFFSAYTRRLKRQLKRLKSIYRHSHDAIFIFDPSDGTLVDFNPRAAEFLNVPAEQLKNVQLFELHDEEEAYLRPLVDDVMDSEQGRSLKLKYRTGDGRTIPAEVSASRIELDDGGLLLCIARDISEREDAAERIQHLAYHDTLTNLPNRTLLTDRINRALARTRRTGKNGALLFLDLDKFKRINDSLGHSVGDELLKELARRLRLTLREEDTVARLGGDEFVVLLEGLDQRHEHAISKASEIAAKIRAVFSEEFHLHGHELYVTSSIGIVTFPHDGETVEALLRHADTAMYHAKGAGRDGARVFEQQMDEAAVSQLRLESELKVGLREGQLELFFQPVLTIKDGRVLGAEVLLRWQHPTAGMIAPTEFLPYIENSALMLKLDEWVLLESCRLLGDLQVAPNIQPPQWLSINISHQQFHQPDFLERIMRILEQTGADPHRLQFEITETILIKDTSELIDRMHAMKRLGISFAIDDFGTGYSSLADLRQLPIDTLKIDHTFIRDIASDPNDASIVRTVLSMAQHFGISVIAEGVETREQLQFLRDAECTYYQGYLGRPPLSRSTFEEELRFSADLYNASAPPPLDVKDKPLVGPVELGHS